MPYCCLHTSLVAMNVVDTYRLASFHSILSSNKATGFRKIYQNGSASINGIDDIDDSFNTYTMRSFAGVLSNQLIKYAENLANRRSYS